MTLVRQSDEPVRRPCTWTCPGREVLSSEYYYLLPNDVLYVPTLKARPGRLNIELLSLLFAGISAGCSSYPSSTTTDVSQTGSETMISRRSSRRSWPSGGCS